MEGKSRRMLDGLSTTSLWNNLRNSTMGFSAVNENTGMRREARLRPKKCLELVKDPSYQNYCRLRKSLRDGNKGWTEEFLQLDGLALLLAGLEALTLAIRNVDEAVVAVECLRCIREVLNSTTGIQYIIHFRREETADHLAKVLASQNTAVKHQVFELFCALCAYDQDGFRLVSKCLTRYQENESSPYVLHVVVQDLHQFAGDESKNDYVVVLLAFVNCILIYVPENKRHRVVEDLKDCYFFQTFVKVTLNCTSEIRVQVDGLVETLKSFRDRSTTTLAAAHCVTTMFDHLRDPKQQDQLLQFIADLDNVARESELSTDVIRKLTSVLHPETRPGYELSTISEEPKQWKDEATSPIVLSAPFTFSRGTSVQSPLAETSTTLASFSPTSQFSSIVSASPPLTPSPPPPAPSPPPTIQSKPAPPPPPPPPASMPAPPNSLKTSSAVPPPPPPPPPPGFGGAPPSPPPKPAKAGNTLLQNALGNSHHEKLKAVRYEKLYLPPDKLSKSVWGSDDGEEAEVRVDTTALKSLFAVNEGRASTGLESRRGSFGASMRNSSTVQLLDSRRSLNINICLNSKKFKPLDSLVESIEKVDHERFEVDDVVALMGILPTLEEVRMAILSLLCFL
ncbi:hypothetical protein RvY_03771-2 [Ramazzottius varieornatus]|uniref:GBD/FH3 domain-containing protein n=1 Tax=Ramazzottius varieornatus TaxID=947166 RepID=A0A1D1UP85_RAMVA|nr:hypothetical protein RvY_03771-2 [Ramazzottius varieornatus]